MGEIIRMPPRSIRRTPTMHEMMNYDRAHPLELGSRGLIAGAAICMIVIGSGIWTVLMVMAR